MKKQLILFLVCSCLTMQAQTDQEVRSTMKRATRYMMDVVSYRGGFVWNYLPDLSRQWGELEARRTMIWMQAPGTPDVGQLMLDAYHATRDAYYYDCACRIASALMSAQLPCGGWNYMYNFAPEDSTRYWYSTIGRQAWRLEEFQHYYGNATFDDEASMHSANFLLRLYLEKRDPKVYEGLRKAIRFVLQSQYANGGWPQRYPIMTDHPFRGMPDYTPFVTINDDVLSANIDFLLRCYSSLGMKEVVDPVKRAMDLSLRLQYKAPLAGWTDQYTPDDLQPAHARSYEPRAINTGTTARMIDEMIRYYRLTGDRKFIEGIPAAIRFIEDQRLPDSVVALSRVKPRVEGDILVARFINPDTRKPMYVHRHGSNVQNGAYYVDGDIRNTIAHYSSMTVINTKRLRAAYDAALRLNQKDLQRNSPFLTGAVAPLPEFYYQRSSFQNRHFPTQKTAADVIASLTPEGYWLSTLSQISNPWKPIPKSVKDGNDDRAYATTFVGDEYDTSPFTNTSVRGISTNEFIRNMSVLIQSLRDVSQTRSGLSPELFDDVVAGKPVKLYTLTNANGMEACITNYGARLVSLLVPDRSGKLQDVVLGFNNITDYHQQKQNFGSTVGRYAGRLTLGGRMISHGGYPGFADLVWKVTEQHPNSLQLQLLSPDGDNGFKGNLTATVTYSLTDENELSITYSATSDQPTDVNLTNHSFFNLSGDARSTVLNETLLVNGKQIAEYTPDKNLTGRFVNVKGTPFDFTVAKPIGRDIDADHPQLKVTNGYDHSFRLSTKGDIRKEAAKISDPVSGIVMRVFTTQPALLIYTGNGLNGTQVGKNGIAYQRRTGICFETVHFADSPAHRNFPPTTLKSGDTFRSQTIFKFSAIK